MSDSSVLKSTAAVCGSRPAGRGIPLSPAQQAALLPERLRGVAATNLFLALEITGALDPAALDRAAVAAVTRHEILRTVYPDDRRIPYQQVADAPETVLETVDLGAAEELNAQLLADAGHRFDPIADLPIRLRLYRAGTRAVLSLTAHPVAADDRSLELLAAELLHGYAGRTVAEPAAQYRDYAMAQMKSLAGAAAGDADLNYWLKQLAELPQRASIAAPISGAESGQVVSPSARRTVRLAAEVFAGLGADAETVVAAGLAAVLAEAGLGGDVPIGIVAPGEAGLGSYANYLVLRVDTATHRTPHVLLTHVGELAAAARDHAGARIERITHQLRGAAAVADGVPFQAVVTVRDGIVEAQADGLAVRELARRAARPHGVDIVADVLTGADGVTVTLDFPVALAGRPEIDALATAFEHLLVNSAAAPDVLPSAGAAIPVLFERTSFAGGTGLGGEPATDAERLIAATIREVLELDEDDEIGRADTFFSLGGDSIAALRMVTLLGERGYALDVQKVFEFPAVHEMAAQLTEGEAAPAAEPSAPVAPMSASGLDPAALAALGKKFAAR